MKEYAGQEGRSFRDFLDRRMAEEFDGYISLNPEQSETVAILFEEYTGTEGEQ